ncbi:tyrosine-type recombinase/integrase [Paraburkholderia sp. J63]|uniref:tyrosine-type recombinase/integrase n=1 Tax=Paraburkholderia sp. J63 TaxID=2805434 RepID=UPI002ABDA1C8|nr:tyrosine-type recombinase/integrase [Paraburkholderia sp. J63]
MAKLTVKQLQALGPADIGSTVRDEGGLWGRVRKAGEGVSVTFWYRYRWQAKTRDTAVGTWPSVSLLDIRKHRDIARLLVADGIDPNEHREAARREQDADAAARKAEARTVRDLYDAWLPTVRVKRGKRGRKDGGAEITRTFEKFVLNKIGGKLLTDLYASDLRPILTNISDTGTNRQATALLVDLKQMFRWGDQNQPWKRLLANSDVLAIKPEEIVSGDYDPVRDNERDRVLTVPEIRQLATRLPRSGLSPALQSAIWIMLSVGSRIGETTVARWPDVDLDRRIWHIPAESAKSATPLDVHLSDFAHRQFSALWATRSELAEADRSDFVFPSARDCLVPMNKQTVGKAIADRQRADGQAIKGRTDLIDALVLEGGQWKCHDLRRSAGTLMQSLGVAESIIHRCLNHARSDKLDRVYLQHSYQHEMAEAWRLLGERLDMLTNADAEKIAVLNVVNA